MLKTQTQPELPSRHGIVKLRSAKSNQILRNDVFSPTKTLRKTQSMLQIYSRMRESDNLLTKNDIASRSNLISYKRRIYARNSSSEKSWHLASPASSSSCRNSMQSDEPQDATRSFLPLPLRPQTAHAGVDSYHSQWLQSQLGITLERSMIDAICPSASLPQLQPALARLPNLIHPQALVRSVRMKRRRPQTWSRPSICQMHWNSLSLNDLDCISHFVNVRNGSHSLSTDSTLSQQKEDTIGSESFPKKPVQPAPFRIPTPPGLPTFGTRRALSYRLDVKARRNFEMPAFLGRLQGSTGNRSDQVETGSTFSGVSSASRQTSPQNRTSELAKQILAVSGVSRIISPLPQQFSSIRTQSLPPGVRRSNSPGILAVAEDGTFMRGTFPARASNHGVGRRNIEAHPYSTRFRSIDEMVRDIDKTCNEADRRNFRNRNRPSLGSDGSRDSEHQAEIPRSQNAGSHLAEDSYRLARIFSFSTDSSTLTQNQDMNISGSSHSSSSYTILNLYPNDIPNLPEPVLYAPINQLVSPAQDGIANFRNYVEEGERTQAQRLLLQAEQREQQEHNCWNIFWSWCCLTCCHHRISMVEDVGSRT